MTSIIGGDGRAARAKRTPLRLETMTIALLLAGGCGGVTPAGGDAAAGSSARGGSGGNGTGGVSGVAGTTGTGGSGTGGVGTGGTAGGAGAGAGGASGASGASGVTGSAGTGGATGAAGRGGVGGGGTSGAGGSGPCTLACTVGRTCCGSGCVNLQNDPLNCGLCGKRCEANAPYCGDGTCKAPPCTPGTELCAGNSICCGSTCCKLGDICCQDQGPISIAPSCFTPTASAPTCPQGCAPQCRSDRNQKKNIAPVDTGAILRKVGELPISMWTYVEEPSGVRHLGPMAQDFRASFGLGADDRSYNPVDAHGVALAAIQALERIASQQQQRIEKLERDNRALGRRVRALDGVRSDVRCRAFP